MGGVGGRARRQALPRGRDGPTSLAAALGLAVGLAIGGLVELLVIRRFANSSRLVLTVATIGLAQVLGGIELLIPRFFGAGRPRRRLRHAAQVRLHHRAGHLHRQPPADPGRPCRWSSPRWPGSCCGPTPASPCGPRPRTPSGPCCSASRSGGCRRWCGSSPAAWPRFTSILKAPFAGSVSTALAGPTLLLPALAAAVVARMESLPRRLRRRRRPRRPRAGRALEHRQGRRRSTWPSSSSSSSPCCSRRRSRSGPRRPARQLVVATRRAPADPRRAAPPARGPRRPHRAPGARRCWPPVAHAPRHGRVRADPRCRVAAGLGHGRRLARRADRLGRPHQPRPVRHRRRRRRRRRQHRRALERRPVRRRCSSPAIAGAASSPCSSGCRPCGSRACSSP